MGTRVRLVGLPRLKALAGKAVIEGTVNVLPPLFRNVSFSLLATFICTVPKSISVLFTTGTGGGNVPLPVVVMVRLPALLLMVMVAERLPSAVGLKVIDSDRL